MMKMKKRKKEETIGRGSADEWRALINCAVIINLKKPYSTKEREREKREKNPENKRSK